MDFVVPPPPFQVSPVDDVLHRLRGVPEANFSSMVQEVSACPVYATSPPPGSLPVRGPHFPPLGVGTQLNLRLRSKQGLTTWLPWLEAHDAGPRVHAVWWGRQAWNSERGAGPHEVVGAGVAREREHEPSPGGTVLGADGLWGRVQHESAPVTQGLENARVGEMVSHLCWVAGAEGPRRKAMGAEAGGVGWSWTSGNEGWHHAQDGWKRRAWQEQSRQEGWGEKGGVS